MANNETAGNRLQNLKGSHYEVADGQPDIRGWDIRDKQGEHLGKVEELIFDVQSRKVRYIAAKLDKNISNNKSRDVLVPIGLAELHQIDDDVFLSDVTTQQLAALPDYDKHNSITPAMETNIRSVLTGAIVAGVMPGLNSSDEFYNHDHFNEDKLFTNRKGTTDKTATIPVIEEELNVGKKTVQTGGAYIRSRVVEQPIEETIRLQEEQVRVERTPVDHVVSNIDFDMFKEGVIELKEYAEVPVVTKEARVVEEITVGKEVTERIETVRDTVRKTEIEIEYLAKNEDTSANNLSGNQ